MRYKQLDALRGIAAISVFLSHYIGIFDFESIYFKNIIRYTPLHIYYDGAAAVILFFVLSGFVLGLPYLNSDKKVSVLSFYFKRLFRIYPAFIIAIIFSLFLKKFLYNQVNLLGFSQWIQSFWNWDFGSVSFKQVIKTLMLIGPSFNTDLVDPVIWSLIVEMKISLLMPFFIFFISKTNFYSNIAFTICIYIISPDHYSAIFIYGIILAKHRIDIIHYLKNQRKIVIASLLVIGIIFYSSRYTFRLELITNEYVKNCIDYLIAIGSSILIFIVLSNNRLSAFFQKRLFSFLGDISYSLYLIHLPILIISCSLFSNNFALSPFFIFITGILTSVAISKIILNFVEIPFQKYASKLTNNYKGFNFFKF